MVCLLCGPSQPVSQSVSQSAAPAPHLLRIPVVVCLLCRSSQSVNQTAGESIERAEGQTSKRAEDKARWPSERAKERRARLEQPPSEKWKARELEDWMTDKDYTAGKPRAPP